MSALEGGARTRRFTPTQAALLSSRFAADPRPSTAAIDDIARHTGLTHAQIRKYFRNRRTRDAASHEAETAPASGDGGVQALGGGAADEHAGASVLIAGEAREGARRKALKRAHEAARVLLDALAGVGPSRDRRSVLSRLARRLGTPDKRALRDSLGLKPKIGSADPSLKASTVRDRSTRAWRELESLFCASAPAHSAPAVLAHATPEDLLTVSDTPSTGDAMAPMSLTSDALSALGLGAHVGPPPIGPLAPALRAANADMVAGIAAMLERHEDVAVLVARRLGFEDVRRRGVKDLGICVSRKRARTDGAPLRSMGSSSKDGDEHDLLRARGVGDLT